MHGVRNERWWAKTITSTFYAKMIYIQPGYIIICHCLCAVLKATNYNYCYENADFWPIQNAELNDHLNGVIWPNASNIWTDFWIKKPKRDLRQINNCRWPYGFIAYVWLFEKLIRWINRKQEIEKNGYISMYLVWKSGFYSNEVRFYRKYIPGEKRRKKHTTTTQWRWNFIDFGDFMAFPTILDKSKSIF